MAGSVNAGSKLTTSLQGRSCWLKTITLWTKQSLMMLLTYLISISHEHPNKFMDFVGDQNNTCICLRFFLYFLRHLFNILHLSRLPFLQRKHQI